MSAADLPPAAPPGAIPSPLSVQPIDDARIARAERMRELRRSKGFIVGAAIVGFWVLCAAFGELVVPNGFAANPLDSLSPPSGDHWFGTDGLGRDVFARVIVGARGIIVVAPLAALLGTALGTALGLVTGYFGGIVDSVLSRAIDALLAIPVVVIGLVALVALGPSEVTLTLVIGVIFTPIVARTVRAAVLSEREREYVATARLQTERTPYILFGELLPNVLAPVLVEFTVRLGYAIFAIATLSFLGFGIQPPAADWGLQIAQHYAVMSGGYWWPVVFPAAAIASLVVGVNLIADSVSQVFDR